MNVLIIETHGWIVENSVCKTDNYKIILYFMRELDNNFLGAGMKMIL